jgi:hypothetical protein
MQYLVPALAVAVLWYLIIHERYHHSHPWL